MEPLPLGSLIVRTWFGDAIAWERLKTAVETPSEDGFLASGRLIDDRAYEGLGVTDLPSLTPHGNYGAIVSFIADETTLTTPEWPLLTVWVLAGQSGKDRDHAPFRVIASSL